MASTERRKAPRIADEELSLEVKADSFDTVTHTLNISSSGLYCKVEKEIPLMSRVHLVLMLPDAEKKGRSPSKMSIDGVVVRQHPVIIDGVIKHYDVAIFFENLSPRYKELISEYISGKKGQA